MRAVNLLPREVVTERRQLPKAVPLAGAAAVPVIALVLVVVGYSRAHSTVSSEQAQLASAQAAAAVAARAQARAAASSSVTTEAAQLAAVRSARLTALKDVLANEVSWDVTLDRLGRVVPAGVWLTDITLASPTPEATSTSTTPPPSTAATTTTTPSAPTTAPAPAAATTTMNGYARTETDVALLLQRLQLLPTWTDVTLGSVGQTKLADTTVVQFSVSASVEAPANTAVQPAATPPGQTPTTGATP